MTARRSLYRKYLALIIALVAGALVVSGAIGIYFSYLETRHSLISLAREKASSAANRIEQFVKEIEHQIGWTALPQVAEGADPLELRRFEFVKLVTLVKPITEAIYIHPNGCFQVKSSRLEMERVGECLEDLSKDPRFLGARAGGVYFGPVYFRKETEPYMAIALRAGREGAGVAAVEVNLKFMWEVIQRIRIGEAGLAYVVNKDGHLVAHPDISLVLQKTDFSALPQVKAALQAKPAAPGEPAEERQLVGEARDRSGRAVITAHARIEPLDWYVFVEQPTAEAYRPLYASLARSGALLVAGLLLSILAGLVFAKRMTDPIRALQDGAAAIGAGNLNQKIDVRTGDELQGLAEQFNKMAGDLKESYAGLERKVEERTAELTKTLEQQTAISEILRVTSDSPTDVMPVLEAVARHAARLCESPDARIFVAEGESLRLVAGAGLAPSIQLGETMPLSRGTVTGRAVIDREPVHVEDLAAVSEEEYPNAKALQQRLGHRTTLAVPLLREERAFGAILLRRMEVRAFSDKQIALVRTFADQAAIAIENVRLFNATREALEQQTATAEVLKAISRTSFDLETVLKTLLENATRLSGAERAMLLRPDGEGNYVPAVAYNYPSDSEFLQRLRVQPIRPGRDSITGRALLERRIIHVADVLADREYGRKDLLGAVQFRTVAAVPMLRDGEPLGLVAFTRGEAKAFSDKQLALMTTFVDQAAIAIENVRLFNEIHEKSRQLEIANRHKSEFLANMSHELRTPLNAIIGFSEVLDERYFGELNEKQADYVKDIHSSGKHLLTLINDILDLSKIEAGRMELDLADFDLPAALQNALTLVKERAQRHGIALGLDVDASLGTFRADERKFKQIMLNLLSNAVKFTPEGGKVSVAAKPNGTAVEVSVADTGVGIAPEDQAAVFEEFKQVGRDYTRKAEGTGLGLALTRRFIELHGGAITLASAPGKGSTFTFTLPFRHGQ